MAKSTDRPANPPDDVEVLRARVAAAERVGELLAHELRNVVIVLRTHADLLAHEWERLEEDDRRRSINTMDQETEYLGDLVSSLLEVARNRPRRYPSIDVAEHLEQRIQAELAAGLPAVAVRHDVEPGLEVAVDVDLLDLAVRNLVRNAVEHGEPPVILTATSMDGVLELRVEDAGPGVPEELLPRLFDRFQQGDPNGPGLGLGLAILRELVERHDGTIRYEGGPGAGSTFVVELPIRVLRGSAGGVLDGAHAPVDGLPVRPDRSGAA